MKKSIFITCMLTCMTLPVLAQNAPAEKQTNKNKGKIILTTFAKAYSGFGNQNDERGFEVERAYLGYQYNFANGIELKTVADFGQSKDVSDMNRIGFLKNAYIGWKKNGWQIYGGLISTTQFKTQEDFWGKRYIMKSFQDEYKMGSSADVGVSAAYHFNDKISADVIIVNGEGYKKLQFGDGLQYGAGVTFKPAKGLVIRAYGSYKETTDKDLDGSTNLAGFAGYKHEKFSIGAEYNYQLNSNHIKNQHLGGTSVYAMIPLCSKVNLFGRYDYLNSNHAWNKDNDGQAALGGVEIQLCKQLKLSPTFRYWAPDASEQSKEYYAYINASFSL